MRRFLALIALGLVAAVLLTTATVQASFGIEPGKVYIENLHPGAEADIPITIYNQNDYEATFRVIARQPDYTETDYETFPHLDWITITPDQVTIGQRGQSEVLVVIVMPQDADYSGKKAEVWVSFMEQDTPGMIKIEIASRLFISTRAEAINTEATSGTSVRGNGSVGITAEVAKGAQAEAKWLEPVSPGAILGSVLGGVLVGGAIVSLVKRRRHL